MQQQKSAVIRNLLDAEEKMTRKSFNWIDFLLQTKIFFLRFHTTKLIMNHDKKLKYARRKEWKSFLSFDF